MPAPRKEESLEEKLCGLRSLRPAPTGRRQTVRLIEALIERNQLRREKAS